MMRTFTFRRLDITGGVLPLDTLMEMYPPMKYPEEVINVKQ